MKKSINDLKEDVFLNKEVGEGKLKEKVEYDLGALYENAHSELSLQQSKRDQIITLYLAIFSFLIPFALSLSSLEWHYRGLIFVAAGIIGMLFALIIIRYRIYKEVYWLCCQSLTVLMNFKQEELDKKTVQAVFYQSLKKKGQGYIITDATGKKRFNKILFFKKNLFSSETIHFMIQAIITAIVLGLGVSLIIPLDLWISLTIGFLVGGAVFGLLLLSYFSKCRAVYAVLADDKDSSFNSSFSKAWFLHFYIT